MSKTKQQGFVSIIVTMVIIVFVTLVAIGFAYLARQNQNQSLNSQLSTQAFYAAESGINNAVKQLATGLLGGNVSTCKTLIGSDSPTLATDVGYTCVLVDNQPKNVKFDSVSTNSSTVFHIHTDQPTSTLLFSWQGDAGVGNAPTASQNFAATNSRFYLPQTDIFGAAGDHSDPSYNSQTANFRQYTGILRATIVPNSAVTSNANIAANQQDVFLYPKAASNGGGMGTIGIANGSEDGRLGDGQCQTFNIVDGQRYSCNVAVSVPPGTDFYIRLKAVYSNVAVIVQAFPGSANLAGTNALSVSGAQAVIDSTGKAIDTLRRIQVRVPLTNYYDYPEYALESGNTVCKSFYTSPAGSVVIPPLAALYAGKSAISTGTNNGASDGAACQLPNGPSLSF